MPDRKGATRLEDLPKEMMHQILIRLPGKAVGRCRAVIKSWCSATSTPEFKLEHHSRQPLLPIVHGEGRRPRYVVLGGAGARTSNEELWPFLPEANMIRGSCDGFLIIYLAKHPNTLICNPVTRKADLLPEPRGKFKSVIGFYCHSPTGEYRVLWLSRLIRPHNWISQAEACNSQNASRVIAFHGKEATE